MGRGDVRQMTDHWWWRPGWSVGTRYLTWHLTLDGQDAVQEAVTAYQAALTGVTALDPVPVPGLHVTVTGLGDTDEVPEALRPAVVAAVAERLSSVPPFTADLLRPVVGREAVVVPLRPQDRFDALRDAVRQGIADAWGRERVVGPDRGFAPHLSIAYAHDEADAAPVRAALDAVPATRATLAVDRIGLIELQRDEREYRWTTVAEVALGGGAPGAATR